MYKYIIGTKRVICMYKFCICTVIGHALPAILTGTTRGLAVVPGRGIQMCLAVPGGLSNITASARPGCGSWAGHTDVLGCPWRTQQYHCIGKCWTEKKFLEMGSPWGNCNPKI